MLEFDRPSILAFPLCLARILSHSFAVPPRVKHTTGRELDDSHAGPDTGADVGAVFDHHGISCASHIDRALNRAEGLSLISEVPVVTPRADVVGRELLKRIISSSRECVDPTSLRRGKVALRFFGTSPDPTAGTVRTCASSRQPSHSSAIAQMKTVNRQNRVRRPVRSAPSSAHLQPCVMDGTLPSESRRV